MSADELQNNLILINHHADDALEALQSGKVEVLEASLRDIKEIVEKMKVKLPQRLATQVERIQRIADAI